MRCLNPTLIQLGGNCVGASRAVRLNLPDHRQHVGNELIGGGLQGLPGELGDPLIIDSDKLDARLHRRELNRPELFPRLITRIVDAPASGSPGQRDEKVNGKESASDRQRFCGHHSTVKNCRKR